MPYFSNLPDNRSEVAFITTIVICVDAVRFLQSVRGIAVAKDAITFPRRRQSGTGTGSSG